jgi:hypothetical protein
MDNDSLDDAGVLALLIRHARAHFRKRRAEQTIKGLESEVKTFNKTMSDCEVALRVFGYDVNQQEIWSDLLKKHSTRVFEMLEGEGLIESPRQIEGKPTEGPPPPAFPPKPRIPTIQEILIERLQEAGDRGSKAAPLRNYIHQTYNIEIHEKTVGMTLYRLLKKGIVRRDGHVWFFVPQKDAETKKPGDLPPGLLKMLE